MLRFYLDLLGYVGDLTIISLALLAYAISPMVRFFSRVRGIHGVLKIAPENDEKAVYLEIDFLPRKDRTFTCNDIIRFYNDHLDPEEQRCVLGQLLGRRISERIPTFRETTLARWRRAVSNVRAITRFLPPGLRGFVRAILAVMDVILDILAAFFEGAPE